MLKNQIPTIYHPMPFLLEIYNMRLTKENPKSWE